MGLANQLLKLSLVSAALTLFPCFANSQGLADLQTALGRLQGQTPIKAQLETRIVESRGEDEDKVVKNGHAIVNLKDDADGLQIMLSHDVLNRLERESNQRNQDEEVQTPTLTALEELEATEMKTFLSASSALQRRIELATFIKEEKETFQGHSARVLHFQLPLESIIREKKTRSYVDRFEGNFKIYIDAQGTPLQTQLTYKGSGRAYIVLSFKAYGNHITSFEVVEGRLVTMHHEEVRGWESTFGMGEIQETMRLQLKSS